MLQKRRALINKAYGGTEKTHWLNAQLVKPANLLPLFPHREKQGTPSSHLDPFTNERRKSDLQKTSTLHETLLAGTC